MQQATPDNRNCPCQPAASSVSTKTLIILLVLENDIATVPAIHHMIHRAGMLDSQFSRHALQNAKSRPQPPGFISHSNPRLTPTPRLNVSIAIIYDAKEAAGEGADRHTRGRVCSPGREVSRLRR